MVKKSVISIAVLAFLLAMPGAAQAYLDPGSTSMIWQLVLGLFAGSVVFLKVFWTKLRSLFGMGGRRKEESEDSN